VSTTVTGKLFQILMTRELQ